MADSRRGAAEVESDVRTQGVERRMIHLRRSRQRRRRGRAVRSSTSGSAGITVPRTTEDLGGALREVLRVRVHQFLMAEDEG